MSQSKSSATLNMILSVLADLRTLESELPGFNTSSIQSHMACTPIADVVDLAMMEAAFRAATSRRSRWCFSAAKSNDRPANALRERALIDELGKGDVLERDTE